MTTSIIFYLALFGLVGMIWMKYIETKRSKKYVLSRLADKTDHIVYRTYNGIRYVLSHINKHNAIALAQWGAFHVLSFVRRVYLYIHEMAHRHPHTKKVIDMVQGKGGAKPNGGTSFYLKRIGTTEEVKSVVNAVGK